MEQEKPWIIPDTLYDTLCNCFKIRRVIHCNPLILPLRAKEYIFPDPKDTIFGAPPYTNTAWADASIALLDYKAHKFTTSLEKTLYSAHAHRHTKPSTHILIFLN